MARTKNDIQAVKITTTVGNDYATIVKSMINAANACKRLMAKGVDPKAIEKMQRTILTIEDQANAEFKKAVI